MMGMGQMGAFCEMAWNQGDDLYGYDGRRFMKAAQYVAKYNLGQDVPFTTYTWGTGQNCAQRSQTVISAASRGQVRPVWAMLHYHYSRRRGLRRPVHPRHGSTRRAPRAAAGTTAPTAAASTSSASAR